MLTKLKMSHKLIGGFIIIVLIMGIAILYQIHEMGVMAELQDEGADRAKDAVQVGHVMEDLNGSYAIFADAIINRNLDETVANFADLKKQAADDAALVANLVDTEAEKAEARRFAEHYEKYIGIFEQEMLPILQNMEDLSQRFEDAMAIGRIESRVNLLYEIIADAIINRDLEASKSDFQAARSQAMKDMTTVSNLVDTDAERGMARQFADSYTSYLGLFDELMEILAAGEKADMTKVKALDEKIDTIRAQTRKPLHEIMLSLHAEAQSANTDMAKIRELDGKVDEERESADKPLDMIVKSLDREMEEADAIFDATRKRAIFIATILSVIGTVLALAIAFSLAYSISKPINEAVKNMTIGSEQVSAAAGQVAQSSQSLAEGASEQAAALEETSASMEEITSMTNRNADNATQADNLMREALSVITTADKSMDEMSSSMQEISAASEETSKIVKTIDEIAFQTNLLALNAAVEAARAGEAGAGFAVVADEVRNLAMRAAEAAKNTAELIDSTVAKVNNGKDIVTKTNAAFKEVAESSHKVGELVGEISAASKEQASGFGQIRQAVVQMDTVTQQNSANAEESAAAAEELNAQAETMMDAVIGLQALVEGGGTRSSRPAANMQSGASPRRHQKIALVAPEAGTTGNAQKKKSPKNTASNAQQKNKMPEEIIPLDEDAANFEDF